MKPLAMSVGVLTGVPLGSPSPMIINPEEMTQETPKEVPTWEAPMQETMM
jgi:hypothetical protein